MTNSQKSTPPSVIRRRSWPAWAALLGVIVIIVEVILVCGSSSLFYLVIPIATGLERPADPSTQPNAANSVAFSPDDVMLAVGFGDGEVQLWRITDRTLLRTLHITSRGVSHIAFSPDGMTLAVGYRDGNVRLWQVDDGVLQQTLPQDSAIRSVAFSPDGSILASGGWDGIVRLWQIPDGLLLNQLEGHTDWISSVAFSPDGAILASGSNDGTVRLWDVSSNAFLDSLPSTHTSISSLAFSPKGNMLATASFDQGISLWRIADGVRLFSLPYADPIWSLAFSPGGSHLAASSDGKVNLWRVDGENVVKEAELYLLQAQSVPLKHEDRTSVLSLAFSPDGATLAGGLRDGRVEIWGVVEGAVLFELESQPLR
jgi:WD40 repeat protein